MKKTLLSLLFICCSAQCWAQFYVTSYREEWDAYPPEVQRRGAYLQETRMANVDNDPQSELILRFGTDHGHYPSFDLFQYYYAVVDNYTKEIQYISDWMISEKPNIVLEDRNNDSIFEIYRCYFKDGEFTVDEKGNNLRAVRCYDVIEWDPDGSKVAIKDMQPASALDPSVKPRQQRRN